MKATNLSRETDTRVNAWTCLNLIASFYARHTKKAGSALMPELEESSEWPAICRAAEKAGFRAQYIQLTYKELFRDVPLPCMLKWEGKNEFAVVYPPGRGKAKNKVQCICPPGNRQTLSRQEFTRRWMGSGAGGGTDNLNDDQQQKGNVIILEPTFRFYAKIEGKESKLSWKLIWRYFRHSHWQIAGVLTAFLIASLVQLIFPFLLQSIVDVGINTGDLAYITIILTAQIMLVLGRISVDFIRSRLLMQISIIVNLSILSDFWIKLTRLPISYFDQQHTGGIMQRINDNRQIQNFLTGPTVNTFFSLFNFLVFAVVLLILKARLFLIFGVGVTLYFLWMRFFLRIRRKINYQIFHASSQENNATLQMVQGMQEIRLQNIEQPKRWEWEKLQTAIFRLNFKNLTYGQLQQAGGILINQGKDIILTFTVAKLVIQGDLTFGAMLAVQYIIGQLTGPIEQFIGFIQSAQDAKISMERLNEIHLMEDEEKEQTDYINTLPADRTITITDLSFVYPGANNEPVLKNIDLEIPEGRTTAIVGVSGSGKTTLLKLLLKFYEAHEGNIRIGNTSLKEISPSFWRKQCGAVLQDGFIFNDTIAKNISLEYGEADTPRLIDACRMSNILSFIESLPEKFNTRLGANGVGISQGQKQRLLIARAVYKNPAYLLFDESTNALDTTNERAIVENLEVFFEGRTVIVVAHRLSTVMNADKIIVLHQGRIIEEGDHHELSTLKGKYFELVRNQLELGV